MIVAENLVYHIQGRRLTDDVSVTLPDGEIIAILGPNGAGKSTLLRQLTGYLQPHSGRCSLFGKPLNEWSITELAKTRAVMRQNSHMAFPFSAQEVIRMGRHPYRTRNTGDETEHIMTLCDCQALARAITGTCREENNSGYSWRVCWFNFGSPNPGQNGCFSMNPPPPWIFTTNSIFFVCCVVW